MDPARVLLADFDQRYNQVGDHHLAYAQTTQAFPDLHEQVQARSGWIGAVPPIEVGEDFRFRVKLMLSGLHNHPIKGICRNVDGLATCCVMKYPLHNLVDGAGFRVGGEGGGIAEGNRLGMRILFHQWLSPGNVGMRMAAANGSAVRIVSYQIVNENDHFTYVYNGNYNVLEEFAYITPEGRFGFEYLVAPAPLQVSNLFLTVGY